MARSTRRGHSAVTGKWLGIVVAVWLNLAAQPCAMALGLEDDCPHCPDSPDAPAHHGHHEDEKSDGCSPLSDCGDDDAFSVDGRNVNLKLKDKPDSTFVVPAMPPDSCATPARYATTATDPPERTEPSRTIHLLNCVFLD